MRLTRPLAVVFAGALLISSAWSSEATAAPAKTKQIAAAFKKARTLYRQGKYQEAIRAFDEVKDLRYHPILDYGIANCYAALRDYNKGIYYLEKYKKNHSKHKMSPKHPSVADVNAKIASWKKLAASAGTTTGTDPTPSGTGTSGGTGTPPPPPTGTGGGAAGQPGHVAGDPLPGPDPYAVPPPPGGGSTGGVYGGGGGAGAPPPPHGIRRRRPARRSLILSLDFGAAAFAAVSGNGNLMGDSSTGGGVYVTALWRFIPYLAVGVHGGASVMGADADAYDYNPLIWAVGVLEARGFIPLGKLDIWASLGFGYASISQTYYDNMNGYDSSFSFSGPALAVGVGVDYFFSRIFSLGVLGRIYKMFPTKACVNNWAGDFCGDVADGTNTGVSWYLGLAATYHFPLRFGRKRSN